MTQCKQNNLLLRDKENCNFDIIENNVQKTGIKVKCVWNDVLDFHVTENFCVDIMHDLFEGVCKYEMGYILHELIFIQKLFTLEALNFKIKYFKYPDNDNKPPLITVLQLQNKYIKMSTAEMKCFILNASLIFGDLIPRRNVFWKLYTLLRQILSIVLQFTINNDDINLLEKLVENHHVLYVKLFKDTLKPKHYFMIHYAHIMKFVGPLIHIWTMRFETKHRPLKQSALMSNNRINLPLTIAIKYQLHMSTLFLDNTIFKVSITYNKLECSDKRPVVNFSHAILNDYH